MDDIDEKARELVNQCMAAEVYRVTVPNAHRKPATRRQNVDVKREEIIRHVAVSMRANRLSHPRKHPNTCRAPEGLIERWTSDLPMRNVLEDDFGRLVLSFDSALKIPNSMAQSTPVDFCPWCGFKGVPW